MKLSRRKRKNIKLFRISHPGDAWDWVDWQWTGAERFDDPEAEYRVLYTGKTLRACLLEVLAHFRPDPALVAD
ncbi:RES domain-containing protein, partial [Agromyces sp. NPDC056379]|uniref:RES domain-containing protein n=1 Tax=Agromyces sp. NPDC056379 TaxID=3345802 RepID=UPI0035D7C77B